MYVTAIVLAAGKGLRFNSRISKPLAKINSKPIITYCLNTLSKHPYIRDIIVAANSRNLKDLVSKIGQYEIGKIKDIVLGGKRRQNSVCNALKTMDKRTDLVLIHDGVRPFIEKKTISSLIKEAQSYGAAIAGVPVRATIKKIKNQKSKIKIVEETIDRGNLWEIQTPQVFRKDLILEAYKKFRDFVVTDDSMLLEKLGVNVRVVKSSYNNIKITTPEDLVVAEAISKNLIKRKRL